MLRKLKDDSMEEVWRRDRVHLYPLTRESLLMFSPYPTDAQLLKSILEPLLEDLHYWFSRSQILLETQQLPFLTVEQQADLFARIVQAQQEVTAAQALFQATGGTAGIDPAVLGPWNRLVMECFQVTNRFYREASTEMERS